ncbi:MAG: hypothetical protein L0027_02285 [Candidatus Rokubacteria bacterium]|nr:hypothetical protein [Candidatus Rokubacteria bacterium]
MDLNEYVLLTLARARLDEARAQAARHELVASLRPSPRSVLAAVGLALIRLDRRLRAPRRRRLDAVTP